MGKSKWARYEGPGISLLCGLENESILHLFVSCSFCQSLWQVIGLVFNVVSPWSSDSLSPCFLSWRKNYSAWGTLPCYILWELWRNRNHLIFEGKRTGPSIIASRVVKVFSELGGELSISVSTRRAARLTNPLAPQYNMMGFFDGASQADNSLCSAGAILRMTDQSYFKLWMNYFSGTNTKGELLGLWILLRFSLAHGLDGMHIYGDSKVIIY